MASQISDLHRTKIKLLVLAYIAFIALGLPTGLLGVAWPNMRAGFSLPLEALGLLLISTTAGYLSSSFIIARLISRFGIGSLLVFSSLVSAAALIGYTLAPSYAVIVGIGVFAGFAGGVTDAGLNTYLAAEYNEGQMQWLHACYGLGATLSPLAMTVSLSLFSSWRPAYVAVGLMTAAMGVCFLLTLSSWKRPNTSAAAEGERGIMDYRTSLWQTLLQAMTWLSILLFLLYTGAEFILGNWTYTLFTEGRGVSPELAGLWVGGFWVTFTIGRILAGLYAHRIPMNVLMAGEMGLACLGAVLFWWNPGGLVSVLGVFLVGFAMAPIFPGLVSSTSRRVGPHHAANTIGMQMSAAALGGALLPSLAGALAQRFSLESIPVLLTISLLGLLACYAISTRIRRPT